ncbi:MAG: zinc metalloprotease HtpX [Planctomycetota bacterium]
MPQSVIDQHQRQNFFQTMLLLLAMTVILCVAGYLMFGRTGVLIAMALLIFGIFFSPGISTAMILRHYRAQRITPQVAPGLIELTEQLCSAGNIRPVPLYYIPTQLPNAFAAGTGKESFVAVTDGLLRMLNQRELAGVLAHEIAHIINHDVRVLSTADTITRTASMFSRMGIFLILFAGLGPMLGLSTGQALFGGLVLFVAPTILVMLQLAISRTREFDADLGAAELTGDPAGLAMALQKLAPPKRKSIFYQIFNPGPRRAQPAMLRTHPPTEERVSRLMELARMQQAKDREAMASEYQPMGVKIVRPPVKRKPRYHPTNGMWY